MSVRRSGLLLLAWLIPSVAHAGHHKFGIFVAGSYLNAKGSDLDLGGWHVSGEAIPWHDHHPWFSLIGDVSAHFVQFGDETPDEATQISLMVGPRITVKLAHPLHNLYGQVLFLGVTHRTGDGPSADAGTFAVGGGYDTGKCQWGLRAQVDYIQPVSSDLGHGWRVSLGGVYRFLSKDEQPNCK